VYQQFIIYINVYQWYGFYVLDKISGGHLHEHLMFSISSESTLIVLFWID